MENSEANPTIGCDFAFAKASHFLSREREWFERLWVEHADLVHAYAVRRVGYGSAGDVVAETFAVAWRRRETVPSWVVPWLYGVARNVISQYHRTEARQLRVVDRMAIANRPNADSVEGRVVDRDLWERVLQTFDEADRETLLLVAWEGLSPSEAAIVMGCSSGAFRMRLSRARRRLRNGLELAQSDME